MIIKLCNLRAVTTSQNFVLLVTNPDQFSQKKVWIRTWVRVIGPNWRHCCGVLGAGCSIQAGNVKRVIRSYISNFLPDCFIIKAGGEESLLVREEGNTSKSERVLGFLYNCWDSI